jgi:hypothetical protein
MNTMTRRQLLRTSALIPVAALAACGGLAPVVAVVTDPAVGALLTALKPWIDGLGVLPAWLTSAAVDPAVIAKVTGWIGQIVSIAGQVGGVTSIGGAVPLISSLAKIFGDVLAALPAGTLPTNIAQLLAAAETYLPTILAIVGMFAQRAPRFAQMSQQRALAILEAAAAGRR